MEAVARVLAHSQREREGCNPQPPRMFAYFAATLRSRQQHIGEMKASQRPWAVCARCISDSGGRRGLLPLNPTYELGAGRRRCFTSPMIPTVLPAMPMVGTDFISNTLKSSTPPEDIKETQIAVTHRRPSQLPSQNSCSIELVSFVTIASNRSNPYHFLYLFVRYSSRYPSNRLSAALAQIRYEDPDFLLDPLGLGFGCHLRVRCQI